MTRRENMRYAAESVAQELRVQADAKRWGTQDAVASWLRLLAERLEASLEGRKADSLRGAFTVVRYTDTGKASQENLNPAAETQDNAPESSTDTSEPKEE